MRENSWLRLTSLTPAANMRRTTDTVFSMFPRLNERRNQIAAHLSGSEQQMLAIGRALMGNPRVVDG